MTTGHTGKFWHCTKAEYDAETEHLRCSHFKDFVIHGAAKYHAIHVARTLPGKERSQAMVVGDCLHDLLIDGKQTWAVYDGEKRTTKQGKADWEKFCTENIGRKHLSPAEHEAVYRMAEAVRRHPVAKELIEAPGYKERGAQWTHASGIRLKCRWDGLLYDHRAWDLKKVRLDTPEFFASQVADLRYDVQQAYYSQGRDAVLGETDAPFYFITACEEPPYLCRVMELPQEAVDIGHTIVNTELRRMAKCLETGDWSDPEDKQINQLRLPAYYYSKNQQYRVSP